MSPLKIILVARRRGTQLVAGGRASRYDKAQRPVRVEDRAFGRSTGQDGVRIRSGIGDRLAWHSGSLQADPRERRSEIAPAIRCPV